MAKKLYLFGIGGTGSRVIKALSMLFAAGAKLENGFDIVIPIIIDPDSSNGDLQRTKDLLKIYQEIHNKVDTPKGFFAQSIKTLQNLTNQTNQIKSSDFLFDIKGTANNSFKEFISFNNLSQEDKDFIKILFSDSNLNADLNVGFKGNPNMGTVVLNQFTKSKDFENFGLSFSQGDAIFIINSIFGGTGAAGFPLLLKSLRTGTNIPNSAMIKAAPIGNITYLPYFNLQNGEIDSDTFLEKTKAAVEYYNRTIISNNTIETIYFIGDDTSTATYENHSGELKQQNDAHFVELAGALAIFDFCKNINDFSDKTIVKEFGLQNNTTDISFDDFNPTDAKIIELPLKKYTLFSEYLNKGLGRALSVSRWTIKKTQLTKDFFNSADFKNGITKFNNYYNQWLEELKNNQPSFIALDNIRMMKDDYQKKIFKKLDTENCLNIDKTPESKNRKLTQLIKLFDATTTKIVEKL